MKKFYLALFVLICAWQTKAQVIWHETFQDVPDNATSDAGATAWSVTVPSSSGTFSKQNNDPYGTLGASFVIRNTGTEGEWTSEDIDISTYGIALIDVTITNSLTSASDYIRVFYQTDNGSGFGPEMLLTEMQGGYDETRVGSSIVTGTKVRIIIRGNENTIDFLFLIYSYFAVDDITVTGIETLYSRKSTGNWNDDTGNSSWSSDPVSGGIAGASCGCYPNSNTRAVIQSGHTIHVNVDAEAIIVEVQNGGTLQWAANNLDLSLFRGGYLTNDGTVDRNGHTNARLSFPQAYTHTITNNGSFTVDDIELAAAATVNLIGSTGVTLNDELRFTTNGATFNNHVPLSFATLNQNNRTVTVNNYSTIDQSGSFSVSGIFNNLTNAIWNWSHVTGATPPAGLNCAASNNTFNYSAAGNQGVRGGITYHHLIFSGTGTKTTANGNLAVNGNLTIKDNARLNVDANNNNINLAGNWTVSSTNPDPFVQGSGSEFVTFNGSANQTVTNPIGEVFNRVTVNKSGGHVILDNNITISNSSATGTDLTLIQGKIISFPSALVIVSDEATANGGDADSYVDGPMKKIGEDDFIFPIGAGDYWARIGVEPNGANSTTEFTAQYFATAFPDQTKSGLINIGSGEYWTLNRLGTLTNNAIVTLYWQSGTRSGITSTAGGNGGDLVVARYNGTDWISAGRTGLGGNVAAGNVSSGNISAADLSTSYTFGSRNGVNPLPVELTDFAAILNNDVVNIFWTTATELNNDFFTLERATDPEYFEALEEIPGHGTSPKVHHYKTVDAYPAFGKNYYRLKQTDFDGRYTYSVVKVVDYEGPAFPTLRAFPNPTNGTTIWVEIQGLKETTFVPFEIIDMRGQKVVQKILEVETPGVLKKTLTFEQPLKSGLYLIKAGHTLMLTQKIVVE